jgi:hypothetical protein
MSHKAQDCLNPSQQKFYNDLAKYDKKAAIRYLNAANKIHKKYMKSWRKVGSKKKARESVDKVVKEVVGVS